jgi:hypothetical protein
VRLSVTDSSKVTTKTGRPCLWTFQRRCLYARGATTGPVPSHTAGMVLP